MNRFLAFLRLLAALSTALAASVPASAAPTGIAQLPLLNLNGTGNVKPNLMLLYDNSGSMAYMATPDYVGDTTTCRGGSTMSSASTVACSVGHPPFNSADFNKQYYNPAVRYTPPVRADGTSYDSMTTWTAVKTDAFGVNKVDLENKARTSTNLTTSMPDLRWCDSNGNNCVYNAAAYTYPTDARKKADIYYTNPYYYTINVSEYCTNANLTDCKTVAVGAAAPSGYPVPAKVRWCNGRDLATCRAKYGDADYKYPRFGNPNAGTVAAYGTITIQQSSVSSSLAISSVTVAEPGGDVVITNGTVTASSGTNTSSRMTAAAVALATSIINKTGLTNQYLACVRTASGIVPACSTYGITLGGDNMVAVVPIECASGTSGKTIGNCAVVADATRNGWAMSVTVPGGTNKGIPTATAPLGSGAAVFVRTDIVPSVTSYPKAEARTDCAGAASCTYAEEMTNFANWYTYYKSRNQMMKTAVGQAFQSLNSNYNVGLVSLELAAATRDSDAQNAINASGDIIRPREFSGNNRGDWYDRLYGMTGNKSTPVRLALDALGNMYANKGRFAMPAGQEIVQYPCQQNFTFITTDGYWNGGYPSVANNDNVENPDRFCTRAKGCLDTRAQSAPSLADVALYWYNGGSATGTSSLRPGLEDWTAEGLVLGQSDDNKRLHMNTYALGLGVDGIMTYEKNYDTEPNQQLDFYKLTTGVTSGCPWNNNRAYVWPDPNTTDTDGGAAYQSRVDDLWHAAINGRGKYFSASDPTDVVEGLGKALSAIQTRTGAASAAATSTPNITTLDNDVFSSTFTTVKWYGELSDRKISASDGTVGKDAAWTTTRTLGQKVAASSDTRTILMLDTVNGGLKPFRYAGMTATEKSWFDNKCGEMSQCPTLSEANRVIVNTGANVVNWLRGWQQYADDNVMRAYSRVAPDPSQPESTYLVVLGDVASSKPAYLRDPRKGYTLAGYADYKTNQAARSATVFVGANDGMLHAFDASNGNERWAYVPRITMKKLYRQASTTYGTNHQYTVDGAPEVADVQIDGRWRSVLVSGLNAGGRGYYALDVTDPANPVALWELCADAAVCAGNNYDADIGLTFGNPQFGTWIDAGGTTRWVVFLTSGYNNVPGVEGGAGGDGRGYLYVVDVASGRVLSKTSTGAGSTGTPSGFARITATGVNPQADPLVTYVYGGDNLGKMWRFDFTARGNPSVLLMGDAGTGQPVTARPEITLCQVDSTDAQGVVTSGVSRVVAFGTGRLLDVPDITDTTTQSTYVLKDAGTGIAAADWRAASAMAQIVLTKTSSAAGDTYTSTSTAANLSTKAGWYVDFDRNPGERVNLDPKVIAGTLDVVTNIPSTSSACTVGGKSNLYLLDACTGELIAGATLSAASAAVGSTVVQLPGGTFVQISTLANGDLKTTQFPPSKASAARKTGWRRVRD